MSDDLRDFLIDLALDPATQARFKSDPNGTLEGTALSAEERGLVLSCDPSRLRTHMTAMDSGKGVKTAAGLGVKENAGLGIKTSAGLGIKTSAGLGIKTSAGLGIKSGKRPAAKKQGAKKTGAKKAGKKK